MGFYTLIRKRTLHSQWLERLRAVVSFFLFPDVCWQVMAFCKPRNGERRRPWYTLQDSTLDFPLDYTFNTFLFPETVWQRRKWNVSRHKVVDFFSSVYQASSPPAILNFPMTLERRLGFLIGQSNGNVGCERATYSLSRLLSKLYPRLPECYSVFTTWP